MSENTMQQVLHENGIDFLESAADADWKFVGNLNREHWWDDQDRVEAKMRQKSRIAPLFDTRKSVTGALLLNARESDWHRTKQLQDVDVASFPAICAAS